MTTTPIPILIADDDPMTLGRSRRALEWAGYTVAVAEDVGAALATLRTGGARIVVADWLLPGGGGADLCRAIRNDEALRDVHVILVTGCAGRDNLMAGLDAGADDYLTMPFDRETLLLRVRLGERLIASRGRALAPATDEVLGVIGHELKTPLSSIRATSEFLITDECRDSNELDVFVRNIHDGIVQLSEMVDDLLESARLGSGAAAWNWSRLGLATLLDEALDAVRPLMDHSKVELSASAEPGDLTMAGDEAAVRRLVVNLVNNARRFTTEGSIRVVAHAADDGRGRWIRIAITDTGAGFDVRVLERTLEPFALNRGVVEAGGSAATGLGLYICRRIAEAHGGSISFESEVGRGTTVQVLLRADLERPQAGGQAAA